MRDVSPNSLHRVGSRVKRIVSATVGLIVLGCAKSPVGGTTGGTRLVFTMTVEGHIHGSEPTETVPFVYIAALNFSTSSNPTTTGPIPVISPPWGNGFVAGNCMYFVKWDPSLPPNGYQIYQFAPNDPTLISYNSIGAPVISQVVQPGGSTLQFSIDLSQLFPAGNDANAQKTLQLNLLTMDRVPLPGDTGQKVWDALGDPRLPGGVNEFVNIPLNASKFYGPDYGSYLGSAGAGRVSDPDLDIVDWSVDVQIQ
jgi:hypothetical protein